MVISRKIQIRLNILFVTLAVLFLTVLIMYEIGYLDQLGDVLAKDNYIFYWMLLVGFLAEIVAGSMGMGYGVICTTTLLFLNIPPHIVSASIHSAESFTTAAGSISHIRLKNVSKSLVKKLAIPAVIGAIIGAVCLTYLGEYYARITKTVIAFYTLYLGFQILSNAFKDKQSKKLKRKTNLTRLGVIGGFIDSFAGGGWGPLVTGTLIKNAFTPRFAVGSSTIAKFILTLTAAITFFITLGVQHWNIILGLLIGGIITAPFSAMLTAKLPVKKMFIIIGTLVIVMSSITIYKSVFS
ncbi:MULTISPECIES: sulfite exporter TauE/SafE family protein [Chryseobacterium]|uniref:Probable membrane transporter protein n=1 Tax=Chryseobacterium camelliae TaxID=1265445 RepID=A0ABU0THM4_9FLAO|nr:MULTISPECIES: sulfite exporter TauE/SafE family protein [Chryseobacterium]MDT3409591.1 putative membrane protein YfcA [Pseudacidovorax intermedius]MDQ1096549.1 putative membrane protein YfcA [Chryseobacterium camelliae]MDQ1100490.1 putative membrane protein YfcA [Chryseobacterium sp. SORGH_AS_1048]MDR6087830.1 putative membrane protein YfcA [Chryseobacterium sp. SORGH_AS_0909]MDR6132206.1 putative membrane protein YfcA [Chryseobacterium sp. SORGH_AS_1175]